MKITDEVYQIGGLGYSDPEDAAVYLLNVEGVAAIIDTGCGFSVVKIIENMARCGVAHEHMQYILLTHCHFDHIGGTKAMKGIFGCPVVAHSLDAPYMESGDNKVTAAAWYHASLSSFEVDIKLKGKSNNLDLGGRQIEAIHVPGHSPGSLVYLLHSQGQKVLFGQDVHGPLDGSLLSDKTDYRKSLLKMLTLEADILCEGHFGVISGKKNVSDFIKSYID